MTIYEIRKKQELFLDAKRRGIIGASNLDYVELGDAIEVENLNEDSHKQSNHTMYVLWIGLGLIAALANSPTASRIAWGAILLSLVPVIKTIMLQAKILEVKERYLPKKKEGSDVSKV